MRSFERATTLRDIFGGSVAVMFDTTEESCVHCWLLEKRHSERGRKNSLNSERQANCLESGDVCVRYNVVGGDYVSHQRGSTCLCCSKERNLSVLLLLGIIRGGRHCVRCLSRDVSVLLFAWATPLRLSKTISFRNSWKERRKQIAKKESQRVEE